MVSAITAVFFFAKNLFPPVDDPPACVEDLAMKLNTKATSAIRYAQLDRFYRRRSEAVRRAIRDDYGGDGNPVGNRVVYALVLTESRPL